MEQKKEDANKPKDTKQDLSEDVLLLLFTFNVTNMKDIISFTCISKYYHRAIPNASLWKSEANSFFSQERLAGFDTAEAYYNLMVRRSHLQKKIKNDFDSGKSLVAKRKFINPTEKLGNFFIGLIDGVTDTKEDILYSVECNNCFREYPTRHFKLQNLIDLILMDKAPELFKIVALTICGGTIDELMHDYPQSMNTDHPIKGGVSFDRMHFLYLLPYIMEVRAIRCFELFIRTMFMSTIHRRDYYGNDKKSKFPYFIVDTLGVIINNKDEYFNHLFWKLAFKIFPPNPPSNLLYQLNNYIDYYFENNGMSIVVKNLHFASRNVREAICSKYKLNETFKSTYMELYPMDTVENYLLTEYVDIKYSLLKSLKSTSDFLNNDNNKTNVKNVLYSLIAQTQVLIDNIDLIQNIESINTSNIQDACEFRM